MYGCFVTNKKGGIIDMVGIFDLGEASNDHSKQIYDLYASRNCY